MASDLNLTRSVARLENDRIDRLEEGLAEVLRRLPEAI